MYTVQFIVSFEEELLTSANLILLICHDLLNLIICHSPIRTSYAGIGALFIGYLQHIRSAVLL